MGRTKERCYYCRQHGGVQTILWWHPRYGGEGNALRQHSNRTSDTGNKVRLQVSQGKLRYEIRSDARLLVKLGNLKISMVAVGAKGQNGADEVSNNPAPLWQRTILGLSQCGTTYKNRIRQSSKNP